MSEEGKSMDAFWRLLGERVVLFDGGIGTELFREGLPQGTCPELWNIERPEVVRGIHRRYFAAGSDVVSTNSFGGSPLKLARHGLESRCRELNLAAARNAVAVKPEGKFVAGSIGPAGKFLKPTGDLEEEDLIRAFAVQAEALTEGGVDFLLAETMYDLREALSALRGARSGSPLPVFVTLTFSLKPRGFFTIMGNGVRQCVQELEKYHVPVVGANCTLDSEAMVGLVKEFRNETSRALLIQANAGQPSVSGDGKVVYSQDMEDYVRHIPLLIAAGANLIGGCCGTTPEYIRRMAAFIRPE
jgi:5-methyltetrahydrofolate--homocysteine methyltransferase